LSAFLPPRTFGGAKLQKPKTAKPFLALQLGVHDERYVSGGEQAAEYGLYVRRFYFFVLFFALVYHF
jgi:hypothetical protein